MFDVGAIVGSLVLDDKFSKPLGEATRGTDKFTSNVKKSENTLKGFGGVVDAVGKAMTAFAAASTFGAVAGEVLRLGGAMEQTRVSLEVFLGSADKANDVLERLNDLANATPFTNDQIIKAGKGLLAFGLEADKLEEKLKSIGDISAGTGKDFNELAIIYGKAMTAGVVQAEELNQLTEAGVPIIGELAKQFGVAERDVKKLGSEGKISFEDLDEAFQNMTSEGGRFFNLMERQSKTFNGLLSTLQGTAQAFVADFGERLTDLLKPALEAIVAVVSGLLQWWRDLDDTTKDIIVALVSSASAAAALALILPALKIAVVALIPAIKAMGVALLSNPIGIVIAAIGALVAAFIFLRNNWNYVVAALGNVDPIVTLKNLFLETWDIITDLVDGALQPLKDIWDSLFSNTDDIDFFAITIKTIATAFTIVIGEVKKFVAFLKTSIELARNLGRIMVALWNHDLEGLKKSLGDSIETASVGMHELIRINNETRHEIDRIWSEPIQIKTSTDGETSSDSETANASQQGKKVEEKLKTILETVAESGPVAGAIFKLGDFIGGELGTAISQGAGKIAEELQKTIMMAVENVMMANELAIKKIQQAMANLDFFGDVYLQNLKKRSEEEIAEFEKTEQAKIDAMRAASIVRMEMIDAEFARKKELADLEFEQQLERDRLDYERKLEQLERDSADEEQRRLARQIMEADWDRYVEQKKSEHNENLLNIEQQTDAKLVAEKQKTDALISQAEEKKNKKVEDLKKKSADKQSDIEKTMLLAKALMEYKAFQLEKKNQLMQANIAYAQAIMSAVQAGASIAASLPIVGWVLGPAFAIAQIAMATQTYNLTRSMIQASQYLPPTGLFAEKGGVINGPRHAQGGVNVNAEGGEAFLDRDLTSRLDKTLRENENSGFYPVVQIQQGAIVVYGNMDPEMIEVLSERIAERIAQRRF